MNIVDEPLLPPNACIISGWHQGPMVDTRAVIPPAGGERRVYIQVGQAVEVGKSVGMVTGEEYQSLKDEVDRLQAYVNESAEQIGKLRTLYSALIDVIAEDDVASESPVEEPVAA